MGWYFGNSFICKQFQEEPLIEETATFRYSSRFDHLKDTHWPVHLWGKQFGSVWMLLLKNGMRHPNVPETTKLVKSFKCIFHDHTLEILRLDA